MSMEIRKKPNWNTISTVEEKYILLGIPRHLDPPDGYLRREAKQMKSEGSPQRGPSLLSDPMKGREVMVPTVKEAGRSIHLIPREELRQPGKEGIIAQVHTH